MIPVTLEGIAAVMHEINDMARIAMDGMTPEQKERHHKINLDIREWWHEWFKKIAKVGE